MKVKNSRAIAIKIEKTSTMNTYNDYLKEIEERKGQGLHPKPIDGAELLIEIISQIKDLANANRVDSLKFFIYNVVPGTTPAAGVKAVFLKEIVVGESIIKEMCNRCVLLKEGTIVCDGSPEEIFKIYNKGIY